MLSEMLGRARDAGVEQIYGLAVGGSQGYWAKWGFTVCEDDEAIVTSGPVDRFDGDPVGLRLPVEPGHRWFLGALTRDPGSPWLLPESRVTAAD